MRFTVDFEVRSPVDLKHSNPWVYAAHPLTLPLCLAIYPWDGAVGLWVNPKFEHAAKGLPLVPGREISRAAREPGNTFEAHNAQFEWVIWNTCMAARTFYWAEIPVDRWFCSAAKAAACALPRSLDGAARALDLAEKKDPRGSYLVQTLCKPRKRRKGEPESPTGFYWNEDPDLLHELFRYCIQDVKTEVALSEMLPDLSEQERRVWVLDARINARGIQADTELAAAVVPVIEEYEARCAEEVVALSDGRITSVKQVALMCEFTGLPNLQAETVKAALDAGVEDPKIQRMLELRQILGLSSTSKYKAILERAGTDGRVRGELLYHGAGTGRWTGRGVQLQNLPRLSADPKYLDLLIGLFKDRDLTWIENTFGDPVSAAKSLTRSAFTAAPGKELICADYSQIEARVILWLAGDDDGLNLFRNSDEQDPYCVMASEIYGREITDKKSPERQVGKTAILGLGFGMGFKRFREQCRVQAGVHIEMKFARHVVTFYRETRGRVPALWRELEQAATIAIQEDREVTVGRIAFDTLYLKNGKRFLRCRLPSGRFLYYYDPRIVMQPSWVYPTIDEEGIERPMRVTAPTEKQAYRRAVERAKDEEVKIIGFAVQGKDMPQITYMGVVKGQWVRETTYGGKLAENITQAAARDVMAEGMLRAEEAGYPVVLTVHDEVLAEIPEGFGSVEEFEDLLSVVPVWAPGLPVRAEGWRGKRYRK